MKNIIFIFIILLPFNILAQEWNHLYENYNLGGKRVVSAHMAYDSGYYLSRRHSNADKLMLTKVDIDGYVLWEKEYNYSESDFFSRGRINTDIQGNVFYAGGVFDNGNKTKTVVLKINSCGEYEWCHSIDIPYDNLNYGEDIFIMENNDLLVHTRYIGDESVEREQLVRFNEYGELIWINQILPEYETPKFINLIIESMIVNNEDDIYMAGCVYMQDEASGTDFWYPKGILVKLDEYGEEEYVSIFDYPNSNDCIVIRYAVEIDNEIMCSGYEFYEDTIANTIKITPVICTFDKHGGELHDRSIQHINENYPSGLTGGVMKINNGIMAIHCIEIPDADKNMMLIELLDDSYNGIDSVLFEDRITEDDRSHLICEDNSMIITGLKWINPQSSGTSKGMAMKVKQDLTIDSISNIQLNYDTLCPYTIEDEEYECDCYQAFYVGIENDKVITLKDLTGLKVYPNPTADNQITIETKTISKNRTVQIYNLEGLLVQELWFPQRSTAMEVSTKNLTPGAYIAKLIIEGKETDFTKFIIQ